MLLKIIDGCVEVDNKLYSIGDIIDCPDERAKTLIKEGYCEKLDKYEISRYQDEQKSIKETEVKKNQQEQEKVSLEDDKDKGESLDDFREKLNL